MYVLSLENDFQAASSSIFHQRLDLMPMLRSGAVADQHGKGSTSAESAGIILEGSADQHETEGMAIIPMKDPRFWRRR